jgi:hypothetical protein
MVVTLFFTLGCSKSRHFAPSAQTLHQIGSFDQSTGTLSSQMGEAGALVFGPYVQLDQANYTVSFHLVTSGPPDTAIGKVDVNGFNDKKPDPDSVPTLSEIRTGDGEQVIKLNFKGRTERRYEFRVWANGKGSIELRDIVLKKS